MNQATARSKLLFQLENATDGVTLTQKEVQALRDGLTAVYRKNEELKATLNAISEALWNSQLRVACEQTANGSMQFSIEQDPVNDAPIETELNRLTSIN